MIVLALSLVVALVASNYLWVRYLRICDESSRKERAALLDRIQAPEKAQIIDPPEVGDQHIPMDADEMFWKMQEARDAADAGIPS